MQTLIKNCVLLFVIFNLTACSCISKTAEVNRNSSINPGSSTVMAIPSAVGGSESTQKIADYKEYSVAGIVNCGQDISRKEAKTVSLLDNNGEVQNQSLSSLNFSGWNHTTNGNDAEWTNLQLASDNYSFNSNLKVNSSCNNVHTLDMVLVKKIADWNHQHANGFECNILAHGYKFNDIESLIFDLKINSAKTSIPEIKSLKKTYAVDVNESAVDALEDGKVNIGITLSDNTNLNGTIIFQLDQVMLSDKWVRVTIPMHKLSFYQEIDYKQTAKTLEDLRNAVINRILIVGETKSGGVLRSKISHWNPSMQETFKEIDVSFKKIELQLK